MQSNPIRFPFILSTAELAFMLTLLEVPHLIGGDNATLFPSDTETRDALLVEGKQQLEASGKLVWQPDLFSYHPNDVMVTLLVPMAFPEIVLTCVSQTKPDIWQGVTYSIADHVIVEVIRYDGQYHLSALPSVDLMAIRLAEAINLPAARPEEPPIIIPRSTFEAVRNTAVPLETLVLPVPVSARLIQALRESVQDVMFSLFRVQQTEITAVRMLGVIIDSLGEAWLVTPEEPEHMRMCRTSGLELGKVLLQMVADLT